MSRNPASEKAASPISKLLTRVLHGAHLLRRPLTLGVRCALFDGAGGVFLVRHTYVPGWYLPGGGVERGETALDALRRETMEEGNIELIEEPALFGLYFNRNASLRDHVALYRAGAFTQSAPKLPDREIAESRFFPLDALPEGTTPATRRRLAELRGGLTPDPYW